MNPYNELHYPRAAFAYATPDNLGAIGRMVGVETAAVETCSMLDLGCASGWHATAIAARLPRAQVTGVDLAESQIEAGSRLATTIGKRYPIDLSNLELVHADAGTFGDCRAFDYITAHGLYSWVDAASRAALLASIRRMLNPTGVALVSFNAMPGWGSMGSVRALLMTTTREEPTYQGKLALADRSLDTVIDAIGSATNATQQAIRQCCMIAKEHIKAIPAYLRHEYLSRDLHADYITDFVRAANLAGLRYVADAKPAAWFLTECPPELARAVKTLAGGSQIRYNLIADIIRCNMFHRAILVRDDCTWSTRPQLQPDLWVSHEFRSSAPGSFRHVTDPSRAINVDTASPIDAALTTMEAAPAGVRIGDLHPDVVPALLQLACMGAVTVRPRRLPFSGTVGARPEADPLVRCCLELLLQPVDLQHCQRPITMLAHEVLVLADGTRTPDEIAAAVPAELVATEAAVPETLSQLAMLGYFRD